MRALLTAAALWATLVLALLVLSTVSARAATVYPECLDRHLVADLTDAGAEPYEITAIRAITRDGASKRWTDYVRVSADEVALSWAHFTVGRLRLPLPDPNVSDADHYWATLAVLYSDASGPLTLSAWRRIVGPAIRAGRAHGLSGDDLALIAAVANSSPRLAIRLGEECGWDPGCVGERYATDDHRRRRVAWLERR